MLHNKYYFLYFDSTNQNTNIMIIEDTFSDLLNKGKELRKQTGILENKLGYIAALQDVQKVINYIDAQSFLITTTYEYRKAMLQEIEALLNGLETRFQPLPFGHDESNS